MKNSIVALTMYFINLILQFYSRKVFLDYLGVEVLGLNTTATNILQFLNLAELGVWSAVATSLYKPLYENEHDTINKIVTFNGLIYRRIAWLIIGVSAIVMCFFPIIFKKIELPLWYAYGSFIALLFSSLLGYFVNYKQLILSADQKDYKIQISLKLSTLIKVGAQIIILQIAPLPYIWWLFLEVLFAIVGAISLNIVIKKTYPFLKQTEDSFKSLKQELPDIITKIKQLFIQKISGFVLFQTSPLIIYSLSSLSLVALYGNYHLIIQGLISLLAAIFNSMLAGIGNLVASSSKEHILNVFNQLLSLRFYIIAILSYGAWLFSQYFITWWIGDEYLLPKTTLFIMVSTFCIYTNRYIVYDYLSAFGYFGDVWASIIEVVLNIGLSISLGFIWGLNGVLAGVLISLIIISCIWKPFYLFKIKLKTGYSLFIKNVMILLLPMTTLIMVNENLIFPNCNSTLFHQFCKIFIFSISLGLSYWIFFKPFRRVIKNTISTLSRS